MVVNLVQHYRYFSNFLFCGINCAKCVLYKRYARSTWRKKKMPAVWRRRNTRVPIPIPSLLASFLFPSTIPKTHPH